MSERQAQMGTIRSAPAGAIATKSEDDSAASSEQVQRAEYQRRWRLAHPDKVKEYRRRWRLEHPGESRDSHASARSAKARVALLNALGGKCVRCGFSDVRALQLDHVNGGGGKEARKLGALAMYRRAMEHPEGYQVLCANCNWIKRAERGEHRPVSRYPEFAEPMPDPDWEGRYRDALRLAYG